MDREWTQEWTSGRVDGWTVHSWSRTRKEFSFSFLTYLGELSSSDCPFSGNAEWTVHSVHSSTVCPMTAPVMRVWRVQGRHPTKPLWTRLYGSRARAETQAARLRALGYAPTITSAPRGEWTELGENE